MSLINKMLQDLDARGGGAAGPGTVAEIRPVAAPAERWRRPALMAGGATAVLVLAAGAYFGWRVLRPAAPLEGPKMVVIKPAEPALPSPAATPITPAPSANSGAGGTPAGIGAAVTAAAVAPVAATLAAAPAVRPVGAVPAQPDAGGAADAAPPASESKAEARRRQAEARQAASDAVPADESKPAGSAAAKRAASKSRDAAAARQSGTQLIVAGAGGELTSQQRAENEYRRALSALQDGRVAEALAGLEHTVFTDPRHEAARQTLVGLLLENKRNDEAVRHLQMGLGLDPKQPGMAMLLARLQMEKGGPAIDTLMRTLPHARGNAEYLGFLAAALQRAQRHGEAAEQYQAALKLSPQNAVWWMGLGISLQADKRNAEARDAYSRARDAGTLTPELQSYVERKLKLLAAN